MTRIPTKIPPKVTLEKAFKYGFQCGRVGPTTENCNFSIFSTPENTKEWERGKAAAEAKSAKDGA